MPNWNEVLNEIVNSNRTDGLDYVRKAYLKKLNSYTGRNTIAYYSGFLEKPGIRGIEIDDNDKNSFMAAVHGLDRSVSGLDLILHTPGGDVAATESLVDYMRRMFGTDIRVIVPQLAMSAGTMIACAAKEIVLGKQSNLGPIDPQFGGIPAHGVIAEFKEALAAVKNDPTTTPIWQTVVSKYHPTFLGECKQAIALSETIVAEWLTSGMFLGEANAAAKVDKIVSGLSDYTNNKTHSRHFHIDKCKDLGLKIINLEDDNGLQDLVLTVHHCFVHTLRNSQAYKIVENHEGRAVFLNATPNQ